MQPIPWKGTTCLCDAIPIQIEHRSQEGACTTTSNGLEGGLRNDGIAHLNWADFMVFDDGTNTNAMKALDTTPIDRELERSQGDNAGDVSYKTLG